MLALGVRRRRGGKADHYEIFALRYSGFASCLRADHVGLTGDCSAKATTKPLTGLENIACRYGVEKYGKRAVSSYAQSDPAYWVSFPE
jgi:hypothetical protein